MSKGRGRRPKDGGKKPVRRSPMPVRLSDLMLRDARRITGWQDPLQVETWASDFLGQPQYAARPAKQVTTCSRASASTQKPLNRRSPS